MALCVCVASVYVCIHIHTHNNKKYIPGTMDIFAHLIDSWKPLQRYMRKQLRDKKINDREYRYFCMHRTGIDINEQVSGLNARTFPKTRNYVEDKSNGFLYHRRGLYVFDFRGHHERLPDDSITIASTFGKKQIVLVCQTETANINSLAVNDEAIAIGQADRRFSKVCGRTTLRLISFKFIPRLKLKKERRSSEKHHQTLEDL